MSGFDYLFGETETVEKPKGFDYLFEEKQPEAPPTKSAIIDDLKKSPGPTPSQSIIPEQPKGFDYLFKKAKEVFTPSNGEPMIPIPTGTPGLETAPRPAEPGLGKGLSREETINLPKNIIKTVVPRGGLLREAVEDQPFANISPREMAMGDVMGTIGGKPIPTKAGPTAARSFIESVKESPVTNPEVVEKIRSEFYTVRNTADAMKKADLIVENFPNQAKALITGKKIDDAGAFIAQSFIKKAQAEGNFDEAVRLTQDLAKKATESGRFSQALSAYSKLSPEGILRYAQSIVDQAMRERPDLKLVITPDKAKQLTSMAVDVGKMAEGAERDKATQVMLKNILDIVPPTFQQKISTAQTMAQLINPKTIVRNVVGNTMFQGLENISQTVATPIDKFMSLFTKKRTTTLPSLPTQAKGFIKGAKEGAAEALEGITSDFGGEKFELPRVPVFRDKILGNLEKVMNLTLRAPDRAAYKAAFDDSIRAQMKLSGEKVATSDMIERAHQMGLYRTFNDESFAARVFTRIKKGLNGGQQFGLGDMILKYPRTPGNILMRAIDYSPAGIVKTIFEASNPLFKREFNQAEFVNSFSRALVGTFGIATAAVLAKMGVISEAPSRDPDVRAMQKESGLGAYQVNISALKRLSMTGFNPEAAQLRPGDTMVTYDWAQPVSINIAMGASVANSKNAQKTSLDLGELMTSGTETLAQQPLLSGLRQFFSGQKKLGESVVDTAKGVPASFTPTILNQVGQATDNLSRMTYSPDIYGGREAINRAIAKIPGLRSTLPPKIGPLGEKVETYQDPNLFNIFLNPAFVSKYKPQPEAQEVIRLMQETGETKQFPRSIGKSIPFKNNKINLTPNETNRYQYLVGANSKQIIGQLIDNSSYRVANDTDKVKLLSDYLVEINKLSRTRVLAEKYYNEMLGMPTEEKRKFIEEKAKNNLIDQDIVNELVNIQQMSQPK